LSWRKAKLNLLVGATGFIGCHLAKYLFERGEISKAIFRRGAFLKILDTYGIQCIEADLQDHNTLHEAFEDVDTVFNLAFPNPNTAESYEYFLGTSMRNLIKTSIEFKVRNFVSLSTIEVYDVEDSKVDTSSIKPRTAYSYAKAEADRMVMELSKSGINVGIVRSARALGEYDVWLSLKLAEMIDAGKVVIPKFWLMSFSHPRDICISMCDIAKREESLKVLNVKSFDCSSIELINSISRFMEVNPKIYTPSIVRRSTLPKYTNLQLSEHLFLEEDKSWSSYSYKPSVDLESTAREIASWYRKKR
jgi:nucleoside-diphosphate-sugar epimerase